VLIGLMRLIALLIGGVGVLAELQQTCVSAALLSVLF